MFITKAQNLILRSSPLMVLVTVGYAYSLHDKREINQEEISKHRLSLVNLDGSCHVERILKNLPSGDKKLTLARHIRNLESSGATVVRSVLTNQEANQWENIVRQKIEKNDGSCIVPMGGAIGRIHCRLEKRSRRNVNSENNDLYKKLSEIPKKISNSNSSNITENTSYVRLDEIAKEYFASHGISEGQYQLSQLQLLDAAPQSSNQDWHRDNVRASLTVIIALKDITNGPTELLLQSHKESLWNIISRTNNGDSEKKLPRILLGSILKGDAMCYDSRVLHRGRGYGNTKVNDKEVTEHRPVLVIRWDGNQTPAPGTGLIGTQLAKWEGISFAFVATLLDWFDDSHL